MKKLKLLSVVLVVVMAFSVLGISTFAATIKTSVGGHGNLYVTTSGTPSAYAKTSGYYCTADVSVTNPDGSYDSDYADGYYGHPAITPHVYGNTAWGTGMRFDGYHYWEDYNGNPSEGDTYYIY